MELIEIAKQSVPEYLRDSGRIYKVFDKDLKEVSLKYWSSAEYLNIDYIFTNDTSIGKIDFLLKIRGGKFKVLLSKGFYK